ncbi:GDSL-like Lipase/Acylhydrolase superfamily protein [Striga asiatica]|uniref:GDSL-like Lipase/Acylhydrolase superfamily protein n=1 Tax=Striga asiatica TaxID=4170 RepID=A0A5A7Q1K3_STRAF|nr:GDSL-like Lipase/Acylhydrolase superfamily protein [Striga asiatica]
MLISIPSSFLRAGRFEYRSDLCRVTIISKLAPPGTSCTDGTSSTMESLTQRSHSISRCHMDFFCGDNGSSFQMSPKTLAARLVIAFEIARAVLTPWPPPDMSSPSNNFENRSFIISASAESQKSESTSSSESINALENSIDQLC